LVEAHSTTAQAEARPSGRAPCTGRASTC
jgi:hypothetical protein